MSARNRPEVIVPIFNAAAVLADCLASLARTLDGNDRVLLIDDASTDGTVAGLIHAFARSAPCRVRVERNPHNLGFVATVNRGMALSGQDVVLLNSDTVVTRGWLTRLARAAASAPEVATVTPFSNHAEICSIPDFCRANPVPDDSEAVAARLAAHPPSYPSLPTAVGFCMLITRRALDRLGDFDTATFGRGYGEENDFCLRASGHGFRHLLCDDAYVVHRGGASFAPLGEHPNGQALQRLLARYPGYNALIVDFIARDPLAPIRARIGLSESADSDAK